MKRILGAMQALFVLAALLVAAPAQADFSKATQGPKPAGCPTGSFLDPRNYGECWSCPTGYFRNLNPVSDGDACTKELRSEKAVQHGPLGCDAKSFWDPRNGGECWSCPSGYERTVLYPVDSSQACKRPAQSRYSKAKKERENSRVLEGCPNGQIWDIKGGHDALGACYSCPRNYDRTIFPVDGSRACEEVVGSRLSRATFAKRAGCPAGEFGDPDGKCWSCPAGTIRTPGPAVTSDQACIGQIVAAATYRSKFGCPVGQFFDPRNGGECWSCPADHQYRTVNPVTGTMACASKPLEIFAVNDMAMCKGIIGDVAAAVSAGEKGANLLRKKLAVILAPFDKALKAATDKVAQTLHSESELRDMGSKIGKVLEGRLPLEQIERLQARLAAGEGDLGRILMNPDLMCADDPANVVAAVRRLGLGTSASLGRRHASPYDIRGTSAGTSIADFLLSRAQAADSNAGWSNPVNAPGSDPKKTFVATSLSLSGTDPAGEGSPVGVGFVVGLTIAYSVDGPSDGGIYLVFGPKLSSSMGFDVSIGAMLFPYADLGEFNPGGIPGLQFSVNAGKDWKPLLDTVSSAIVGPSGGGKLPDGIDIGVNFSENATSDNVVHVELSPGVGFSRGLFSKGAGGNARLDLSATATYSFPLLVWRNGKRCNYFANQC